VTLLRRAAVVVLLLPAPLAAQSAPAIQWARIPAGTFQQGCVPDDSRCDGDEYPRHPVVISRPFELMTTEVSVGMMRAAKQAVSEQPAWSTAAEQPAVVVAWDSARTFCEAVGGRLPTEAEWEYAARGGRDGGRFPWGSDAPAYEPTQPAGAVFEGDAGRAVGSFTPNAFGLHHMAGNVWEWVADWFGPYPTEAVTDPRGPEAGEFRIVRGGSYGDDERNLRASNRNPNRPRNMNVNVGFRCARDLAQ
jgi:formylglycine-generating enzyme required for sulfatase activity